MKFKEILEKSPSELETLENKLRMELTHLRLQSRAGQLAQTAKLGQLRRDIARALTAKKDKSERVKI